jgi:citrate synthase
MTTQDFIITLFYAVDQEMLAVPKHPDAKLYPSEVVTLALLHAIKGGGTRAFYRWLTRAYLPLFPQVPDRTRLARLFKTHTAWTTRFLAMPTVLGVADSDGIELLHLMREGRSSAQIGKKGQSNYRWMVGGKLGFILKQWGLMCAWDCATANIHETPFHPLIAQFDGQMIVLTDTGFHAKTGDPANMQVCPRGTGNARMLVETVLSMLTTVCHSKKMGHRVWASFHARVAWTMAAFNLLARWGLEIDDEGLPGFGHRLYPDSDPRAMALFSLLAQAYPTSPALMLAHAIIREATAVTKGAPTIDFALAAMEHTLQLPYGTGFTLFAIGRTAGWIGHALEQYQGERMIRPRARYIGVPPRP